MYLGPLYVSSKTVTLILAIHSLISLIIGLVTGSDTDYLAGLITGTMVIHREARN